MDKKIFKGFKQVTRTKFNEAKDANELSGYLWFVRTEVVSEGEETNNVVNDEYDIYFGAKQYGHFCEGEISGIKDMIESLNGDVSEIVTTLETLTGVVETNTQSIQDNKAAHEANAKSIEGVQKTLENYLIKNVDSNDKVLNVADGIISSQIGLVYENGFIKLTGKGHTSESANVIAEFSAADFVKDSVLENVEVVTREDEKYIVFTWKTEGEETKTDEIKVSDFAKLYEAGTALELDEDGVTFNVKVASNDNFISVNDNNELIVDDITTDKTIIKEAITIEGGPLASADVKGAFEGGVIPAGTDIQAVLKALLCVEIYPTPTANTPTYSVSISAPTITANVNENALVEVGQQITFNAVTAKAVTINKTNPKVGTFDNGYSTTIDGEIVESTNITSEWTVSQMDGNVYELTASIVSGFTGTVPTSVQNATASNCVLASCTLTAAEGTNTYKVLEDAPKHTGSHNGVASAYIVSNLKGRSEDKKSPSIAATTTNVEKDPENKSKTFTVTGLYPIYTNGVTASTIDATAAAMADLANPVSDYGTKLPLMKASTSFAVSFAHQDLEGYSLCLPGTWKISTAKAIDPLTKTFADDCKSKFVENGTVTKQIQGKDVTYKVYTYSQSAGPNRVKFTVA